MIYFDKIPPGDQITLIRPKPGGLEPKCKYWQAASFFGRGKGSHSFCSCINWDGQTQHLQHIVEVIPQSHIHDAQPTP